MASAVVHDSGRIKEQKKDTVLSTPPLPGKEQEDNITVTKHLYDGLQKELEKQKKKNDTLLRDYTKVTTKILVQKDSMIKALQGKNAEIKGKLDDANNKVMELQAELKAQAEANTAQLNDLGKTAESLRKQLSDTTHALDKLRQAAKPASKSKGG